jgi:polar amino acid transport system substrate-binding protein
MTFGFFKRTWRACALLSIALTGGAWANAAHADATLDRIKARGTLVVGVVLDGRADRQHAIHEGAR